MFQNKNKFFRLMIYGVPSQPTFTCSKLTTETLEKGVKYVKFNNIDTRTRTYFTPCSSVSIADFEQINAGWDRLFRCVEVHSKLPGEICIAKSLILDV